MHEELVNRLRELPHLLFVQLHGHEDVVYEAAEAIEELQQTVEHYKGCSDDWYKEARDYKAMLPRWIPVTERLPEDIDEEVLVCTEDYGFNCLGFVTVAIYSNNRWIECWNRETDIAAVTHWMPLPEPPKEETV